MLFMGEEYGETAPFQYFVDHSDPELLAAVRRGRAEEFASFGWQQQAPDPAAAETAERCRIHPELASSGRHQLLHELHRTLLEWRQRLGGALPDQCIAFEAQRVLFVRQGERAWLAFSFAAEPRTLTLPVPPGNWQVVLASAEERWGGPGVGAPWLESRGELSVRLEPYAFLCCVRQGAGLQPRGNPD